MTKITKIMLALPNTRWFGLRHFNIFPYTLGLLTAALKDRYDVRILDANIQDLDFDEVKNRIAQYKPDVFGISIMSMESAEGLRKLASIAKFACPETKVIAGGIYPTLLPDAVLRDKEIDFAVLGEGEYRLGKLSNLLKNLKLGEFQQEEDWA